MSERKSTGNNARNESEVPVGEKTDGPSIPLRSFNKTERDVLVLLMGHGPCSGADVLQFIDVSDNLVYIRLGELEKKGLVKQQSLANDGRKKCYELTPKGKQAVRRRASWHQIQLSGGGSA
jgi:DNA-binding MarR family transcriptional regulator